METQNSRKSAVIDSVRLALLGEISARLRAVLVDFGDDFVRLDCYFDGEIEESDVESIACAETELMASFPENHGIKATLHRLDFPAPIPKRDLWFYCRKE